MTEKIPYLIAGKKIKPFEYKPYIFNDIIPSSSGRCFTLSNEMGSLGFSTQFSIETQQQVYDISTRDGPNSFFTRQADTEIKIVNFIWRFENIIQSLIMSDEAIPFTISTENNTIITGRGFIIQADVTAGSSIATNFVFRIVGALIIT